MAQPDTYMPKTAIVTGVAGFIGFHVADTLLKEGVRVVGIDNVSSYYDPRIKHKRLSILRRHETFQFRKLDITEFDDLLSVCKSVAPDEVIHLAAQAGVRYSLVNPWAYVRANELGTLNVFEVARVCGLPRVVYASSSSVYGIHDASPMRESDRTDWPLAVYGASKKANEVLAHAYHHLHGIEMVGLRFFTVYGIWGRPDLALFKFTRNMLAGEPIDVYNRGRMKRSLTHVQDVVSGVRALLMQRPSKRCELYNMGGAEAVSLLSLIRLIEKETGMQAKKNLLPMQPGDVRETVADCSKAKRDFGFAPRVSVGEGVAEFVTWFKEHQRFLTSLKQS